MRIGYSALGLIASAAALTAVVQGPADAAGNGDYGQYSRMFERSAGQYFTDGKVAGQWAWRPVKTTVSDISWGDPAKWPPGYAERFVRSGDWVELDGYSDGQGKPVTSPQRVTQESTGTGLCTDMKPLASDGGRQHYVRWTIPGAGYCLDATGTITSNGSVVHFRHRQQWGAPAPCSNAYLSGKTCIKQHEQWWDDHGHPYALQIDRTQLIARGLGMAFSINQTVPSTWSTAGHSYWTW